MNKLRDILKNLKDENNTGITIVEGYNDRQFISYQQLYTKSSYYLNRLRKLNMQPGQEFIIVFEELESFIYLFWACILGGIIPIPVSLESGNIDKIINILSYCNDPYVCGNEQIIQGLQNKIKAERVLSYDDLDRLEVFNDEFYNFEDQGDKDDIAFIQFSSGSTSAPKGVKLTSRNLICNIRSILKARNITSTDKFLNWMPLTHDMGLIFLHLTPMYLGLDQIIIPTSKFILHPLLWMQAVSDYKATLTGSTNFCLEYFLRRLKSIENLDWDLACLNHIIIGAEMISVKLCEIFANKMKYFGLKKECLVPGYGLAEASVCVSLAPLNNCFRWAALDRKQLSIGEKVKFIDKQDMSSTQIMCVGKPFDDVMVRIIDLEKNVLEDGYIGLVSVKGKNVTEGYYNNTEYTKQTIDQDNWLNTGDIGFIYDNQLYITGRYKDIIFYNGKSYFSNDFEEFIIKNSLAKYNQVVVVGVRTGDSEVDDHLVCFLRYKSKNLKRFYKKSIDIKRLMSAYAGIKINEVLPVHQIPKTTSGKVKRFDLKERYINQEWKDIICKLNNISEQYKDEPKPVESTENRDIENIVVQCFADVLGIDVDLDENLTNYNMNSLSITEVYKQLNEKFPQLISVADLYEYTTVNLLAGHIRETI